MNAPRVIALHRPSAISGVSAAGARLAALATPFVPLIIGEELTADVVARSPLARAPGLEVLSWPKGTDAAEQVRLVLGKLAEMRAEVVVPNDLPHGFVAAATDRRLACAAICHGDDDLAWDLYERALPLSDAWLAVNERISRRAESLAGPAATAPTPCGLHVPSGRALSRKGADGPLRLVYAGCLEALNKRADDLPALCDSLSARGVAYELRIAGDGPRLDWLRARLSTHADRVTMLGAVRPEEVERLIDWCDALVLMSRSEGCPLVVMEAMAAGRAVAITEGCGGAVGPARRAGAIVAPVGDAGAMADGLAGWAADRRGLGSVGEACRREASRSFDLGAVGRRFETLALAACERRRRAPAVAMRGAAVAWDHTLATLSLIGPATTDGLSRLRSAFASSWGVPEGSLVAAPTPRVGPASRRFLAAAEALRRAGAARIACFGAGRHSARVAEAIRACGVVGFVDEAGTESRGRVLGLPVVTPTRFDELHADAVVISSDQWERELSSRARALWPGLPVATLYDSLDAPASVVAISSAA